MFGIDFKHLIDSGVLRNNGVARRLILALVLFSSVITGVITAVELYLDYRSDLAGIEERFKFVGESYLPTLADSVWVSDQVQIKTQLDGLLRLRDMEFLGISVDAKLRWSAGARKSQRQIARTVPIVREYRGRKLVIGELVMVASVDAVLRRIWSKLIVTLVSNGVKTLLVASFMLLAFQFMVGQHLERIAEYMGFMGKNLADSRDLQLSRSQAGLWRPDALDLVTGAINRMRHDMVEAQSRARLQGEILELNNRLLRSAGESESTGAVLGKIIELCHQAVAADQAFVLVHDKAAGELVGVMQTGAEYRPEGHFRLRLDEPSLGVWAFKEGHSVAVEDATHDARVSPRMRERFGVQSSLAAPLRLDEAVTGVLMTTSRRPRTYSPRDLALLEGLAREATFTLHTQQLREARLRAEAALGESEVRFQTLLEAAPEPIIVHVDGRYVYANPAAREMLGARNLDEIVGKGVLAIVHSDSRDLVRERVGKHASGEPLPRRVDQRWMRFDGTPVEVEVTGVPFLLDGKRAVHVMARDITERKKLESQLMELNAILERRVAERTAELEYANKELEAFSYSVSHDLRAPLRTITGFSAIVLEAGEGRLEPEMFDLLKRIRAGAERMDLLIDDLLKLSRVSRLRMHRRDFDLSDMADQVIASLIQAHPQRSVQVTVRPGMVANGDPGLVRIALENLIGNAWKFTSHAGAAKIDVGREEHDGETTYFVRDNGAGFDMQYADRLFAPFQRLHKREEFEGTGVGLSIVRRIFLRHGGRVWAEAKEGQGAAFYFTFGAQ